MSISLPASRKWRSLIVILVVIVAAIAYSIRKTDISPEDQLLVRVARKSEKSSEESKEETEGQKKDEKKDESAEEGSGAEMKRVKRDDSSSSEEEGSGEKAVRESGAEGSGEVRFEWYEMLLLVARNRQEMLLLEVNAHSKVQERTKLDLYVKAKDLEPKNSAALREEDNCSE
ncbi:hypothetical protein OSTOST_02503 [Ostertagia ostertagi]